MNMKTDVDVWAKIKNMFAGQAGDCNENQLSRGPWSWLVIYMNTNTHLWAKIKSIFADEAGDGCDSLSASDSKSRTETPSRRCKVIVGSSNSFFFWLTIIPTQPSHVIQLSLCIFLSFRTFYIVYSYKMDPSSLKGSQNRRWFMREEPVRSLRSAKKLPLFAIHIICGLFVIHKEPRVFDKNR